MKLSIEETYSTILSLILQYRFFSLILIFQTAKSSTTLSFYREW